MKFLELSNSGDFLFSLLDLSHSTTLLALPYILREESLHYFDIATSNQPRFRYNTLISDISDIEFLTDASRFDVLIERFQIASSKDFIRAFAILMASFYAFNVEYPKKLEGTLIFIQKIFLKISDKQKSPSKVLRLISSIKTRDCGL